MNQPLSSGLDHLVTMWYNLPDNALRWIQFKEGVGIGGDGDSDDGAGGAGGGGGGGGGGALINNLVWQFGIILMKYSWGHLYPDFQACFNIAIL